MDDLFTIQFPADYDERAEFEATSRGLLDDVLVKTPLGTGYRICFMTSDRLKVECDLSHAAGLFAVPIYNTVVLRKVQRDLMVDAIHHLGKSGKLELMRPE